MGQGGLGLWGDWGPSNSFPNSREVKSARTCFYLINTLNYTIDTGEVAIMVKEVVVGNKENAKPLALGNLIAKRIERIELSVRNAPSLGSTTLTPVIYNQLFIFTQTVFELNYSRLGQYNSSCSFNSSDLCIGMA